MITTIPETIGVEMTEIDLGTRREIGRETDAVAVAIGGVHDPEMVIVPAETETSATEEVTAGGMILGEETVIAAKRYDTSVPMVLTRLLTLASSPPPLHHRPRRKRSASAGSGWKLGRRRRLRKRRPRRRHPRRQCCRNSSDSARFQS